MTAVVAVKHQWTATPPSCSKHLPATYLNDQNMYKHSMYTMLPHILISLGKQTFTVSLHLVGSNKGHHKHCSTPPKAPCSSGISTSNPTDLYSLSHRTYMPWMYLWRCMVYSLVTTSFRADLPFLSDFGAICRSRTKIKAYHCAVWSYVRYCWHRKGDSQRSFQLLTSHSTTWRQEKMGRNAHARKHVAAVITTWM